MLSTIADKATLDSWFKKEDFNQFLLVAKGHTLLSSMNGHLISVFIDNDPSVFPREREDRVGSGEYRRVLHEEHLAEAAQLTD